MILSTKPNARRVQKIQNLAAEREARIALYEERAAQNLGIFTGLPIPADNPREDEEEEVEVAVAC